MQTKTIIFRIFIFLLPLTAQAQTWKWAQSLGSTNNSTTVKNIRPYTGTTLLVSGSFAAPNLSLGNQTISNAGQDDGYLAIMDETGQYSWAANFGGAGRDFAVDAAAATNGDFWVAGNFNSISMSIGSVSLLNSGETDAFVVKYKADKTLAWAKKIGSGDIDEVSGIVVDTDGNVYVSGYVQDKFTLAMKHVFIRKLDAAGNQLWERKGEMTSGHPQGSLAIDSDQNIYLSGSIYGMVSFGNTTMTSDTSYGAFIVKYNPSGALLDYFLNTSLDKITGLHASGGNLYACAEKQNGFCFGWGWPLAQAKIAVLKLDADLNTIWNKSAGGETSCQSYDIAKGLSVDQDGNTYVTGYFFSDTLHFAGQSLPNPFNLQYYYPQIFVFKYSPNGNELWGKSIGGIHSDEATCIHAIGDDKFYLGGNFESNPVTFGAYNLGNTSSLDSIYVHLRPSRYGRKPMGFLAIFDKNVSTTKPEPTLDGLSIFPNPANNQLTMRLKSPNNQALRFQLHSTDGRLLRQSIYSEHLQEFHEDLSGLPPGMYFVTLRTEDAVFSGKLMKN